MCSKAYYHTGNCQHGSIMVASLLTMLIVMVIGVSLLTRSISETRTAASYRDGIAAQYLAESGVKYAKAWIVANGCQKNPYPPKLIFSEIGACSIQVKSGQDSSFDVAAIATVGTAKRQMTATLLGSDDPLEQMRIVNWNNRNPH